MEIINEILLFHVLYMLLINLLCCQGYRTAAEQQIVIAQEEKRKDAQALKPDLESLRRAASIIYDQYLSDKVHLFTYMYVF